MNRIHKSIFNEQTGTYVAVSENTKAKGKSARNVLAATALSAALGFGAMGSAQAQLVDACAGVSLPRSVVTDIVGDVVTPIYTPIEGLLNGLLGGNIPLVGSLGTILGLPNLNLNLTDILTDAANGDPITLQVLDANGEAVGPADECNLVADSVSLTDPAGIAIGGNKISGLGANGQEATAGHMTAIAFGNNANAEAANSIAFGTGAEVKVNATGAVALGAGSLATDEWTVSVGNDGSDDPAEAIQRRITNVADGIDENDAATFGQLSEAINNITTSGLVQQATPTSTITVGKDTAGLEVDFTGKYLDGGGNEVAQKRKLVGVADGDISKADSDEAVTGGQLHATNQYVADALGGGAAVELDGTLTAPEYELDYGVTSGLTGAKHDNVGSVLGELAGHVGSNTTNINKLLRGEEGIVKYDDTTDPANPKITVGSEVAGKSVDFTGTDGVRKLTGIADGDLSETSTDAVTGKQLAETNKSITTLSANAVQYDGADKSIVTLGGTTGTTLDNVKAGTVSASSMQAINGSQLYRSTSDLAAALGGNAEVDPDGNLTNVGYDFIAGTQTSVGDALLNLDTRVDSNTTNITNLMNGTSGLVQQANGTAPITVGVATGGTTVDFTGTDGVRKLTGVANGSVAAGSTDAITGDQLFTSSKSVADALGGGSTVDPTTGAVSAPEYELDDGTDSGTKVTVTGVEDALTNLDGRVASNTTEITTIKGDISNIQTDITNITNGTLGIVKQNATTRVITVGGDTDGTEVNFAGTAGVRKLTGIANGNVAAGSSEAVTGDQLNTTNLAVAAALTALGGGASIDVNGVVTGPVYNIGGATFNNVGGALTNLDDRVTSNTNRITTIEGDITDIRNGTAGIVKFDAAADKITVGSEVAGSSVDFTGTAGARKLTGIADGELSATSSDAVTGKQLNATNQQVKASSQFTASALGGGAEAKDDGTFVNPLYALQEIQQDGSKKTVTFDNVGGALTSLNTSVASLQDQVNNNTSIGLVRQDSTTRVISVGGNTDGTEVNFANSNGEARVISGVAAGKGPTDAVNVQQAQEMIAGATNSLKGDIRRAEKRADAGAAAATAVATLGQAYQPGQSAFSVGGGTWRGEAGYAVGLSTVSENGKWLLKGAVSGSGRGGAGGGASVTYLW